MTDPSRPTEPTEPTEPTSHAAAPGPHRSTGAINPGPVQYKGETLEAERGPGLGCFRFQLVALGILILATPLSVGRVPDIVTAIMLFVTIGLLLVGGQTIIFLLRLVAADRRGRRAPLAPRSPTVGQLEDAETGTAETGTAETGTAATEGAATTSDAPHEPATGLDAADPPPSGPVRQ